MAEPQGKGLPAAGRQRMRRAERREQILAAATKAFARAGFTDTSLDDVAAQPREPRRRRTAGVRPRRDGCAPRRTHPGAGLSHVVNSPRW